MSDDEKNLTPTEAIAYLREHYGEAAATTIAYLEKLRTVGGGPKFKYIGRRVVYTPPWLDAWVISRTSRPMSSTSEAASRRRHKEQRAATSKEKQLEDMRFDLAQHVAVGE